jgi:hypothetical protein
MKLYYNFKFRGWLLPDGSSQSVPRQEAMFVGPDCFSHDPNNAASNERLQRLPNYAYFEHYLVL